MRVTYMVVGLLVMAGNAAAQQSPYVDLEDRAIKALSAEDVDALLAGEGMGYALAAELNGYPGPLHILEFADSLSLDDDQRLAVQTAFDRMQERARALGTELVRREAGLDSAFTRGSIDAASLEDATAAIAAVQGELRFVHLEAHLEMMGILSESQIHRYQRLRGYHGVGHEH